MKIKFIRSVIADGKHHEAGTVAEIPNPEAVGLLSGGDATPEKASRETASIQPAAETAAHPPATAKKAAKKK